MLTTHIAHVSLGETTIERFVLEAEEIRLGDPDSGSDDAMKAADIVHSFQ